MKNPKYHSKEINSLLIIGLVVFILWLIGGILPWVIFKDWNDRAAFGNMLQGISSLFSGLAFAGLIYAIILQKQELSLQRNELELTREEIARTAKAQEGSEKALKTQIEALYITAQINGLSSIQTYLMKVYERGSGETRELWEAKQQAAEAKKLIAKLLQTIENDLSKIGTSSNSQQ